MGIRTPAAKGNKDLLWSSSETHCWCDTLVEYMLPRLKWPQNIRGDQDLHMVGLTIGES
jgi:hypothetical protein